MTSSDNDQPAVYNPYADPEYLAGLNRPAPTAEALAKEIEEMGGDPSMMDSCSDASLDDIEIPHPSRVLTFNQPPMPQRPHDKAKSLAHLIAFLAEKGPGWKFQPHEVAAECMPITGKTAQWYRGALSGELLGMGVVERSAEKGEYRVSRSIRSEDTRRRVEEQLSRIPANA